MDEPQALLTTARLIRDDFYGAQDALDALAPDEGRFFPLPLALDEDYRLLAAEVPAEDDELWRDVAGARRRLARFLWSCEWRDPDLNEARNLHGVLDVARARLCTVAGLEYRQHCGN